MRAICLSCGADKVGALAGCGSCGAMPNTPQQEAHALLASAEHCDQAALDALSTRVRSGGFDPAEAFDADVVDQLAAELEAVPHAPLSFVLLVVGVPVIGALLVGGLLVVAILAVSG